MVQVGNGNHATYSDGNLCVHCLEEFQLSLSLPDAMEEPQVMIVTCAIVQICLASNTKIDSQQSALFPGLGLFAYTVQKQRLEALGEQLPIRTTLW